MDRHAFRTTAQSLVTIVVVALMSGCIPAPAASRSAETTPSPQWTNFHESNWGYSIEIPAGWMEITRGEPLPTHERDFSNEAVTDASTLVGLDNAGFFFRVAVNRLTPACPQLPADGMPNFEILIDGYPATALIIDNEEAFSTQVSAVKVDATTDRYCYTFTGVARSTSVRNQFLSTVIQMLSTFKFGTPTSAP